MRARIILISAAVLVVGTIAFFIYKGSNNAVPIIFAPKNILETVWMNYRANFLEQASGRTFDPAQNYITTSEGEGYTMLRAVWMDDHATFDKSWTWTKDNLQFKQNGYLFSWLFGRRPDGTYGIVVSENGQNSASDADTDIAMALLFAYSRWRDPSYLEEAQHIIGDIWTEEVVTIDGRPYMAADNLERKSPSAIVVNPSYLSPYAYRMFATIDSSHDWNGLVDSSYALLEEGSKDSLGLSKSDGLPPDWIYVSRATGAISTTTSAAGKPALDTNYGFDALRIPWRIYLDYEWYDEPRARDYLSSFAFLPIQWQSAGVLNTAYGHDGTVANHIETPAMYGGSIGAFMIMNPSMAKQIYEKKLVNYYNPDSNSWKQPLGYYDDNWAWFGIALYNHLLPNFWASVDTTT